MERSIYCTFLSPSGERKGILVPFFLEERTHLCASDGRTMNQLSVLWREYLHYLHYMYG